MSQRGVVIFLVFVLMLGIVFYYSDISGDATKIATNKKLAAKQMFNKQRAQEQKVIDPATWDWDNQNIVYVNDKKLYITNHNANPVKHKIYNSGNEIFSPEWSPDGTKILFLERDTAQSRIYIKTIDKFGALRQMLSVNSPHPDIRDIHNPVWSEDSRSIYYYDYSRGSTSAVQNQATGEVVYSCEASVRLIKINLDNEMYSLIKHESFYTTASEASGVGSCNDEDLWEDALSNGDVTCEGEGGYRPLSVSPDGAILANVQEFTENCEQGDRYLALVYSNGGVEHIGDAVGDADWFCDGNMFVYYGDIVSGKGVYTKDLNTGIIKTVDANEVTNTVAISDKPPVMDIYIAVGGIGLYDYQAGTPKRNLGLTGSDADFKVTRWPCK